MRNSGPPKGLVSYLVFELLDERPRYGYEILKEITGISGGHWEPSYGSVYPILHKFESKGWTRRVDRDDDSERKYFELTDEGRAELAVRREEAGERAREFADIILGFYHVYGTLATDDRFPVESPPGAWGYDETWSAWIIEQLVRHHERDFGPFERIDDTPSEFYERQGIDVDDGE